MVNGLRIADRLQLSAIDDLHQHWLRFLVFGVALIVLGAFAVGSAVLTTVLSLVLYGWLLVIGGILEIAHGIWRQSWSGFFVDLAIGVLYMIVGIMVVANPAASAIALTLLIAMFLIVGGIFRIVAGISARYHNWGWLVLHGVVSLLLGIGIWEQWPESGFWIIGLFIGIELLVNGVALVMLGMAAKRLPVLTA